MTQVAGVLSQDFLYFHPELLVAFIGNHDGPRFLTEAGGDIKKLMMAQAFVLTTRRVPHLYYGDEIAMGAGTDRTDRSIRADFPGGFPGDPVNAFTPEGRTGDAERVFTFMRNLLHFRLEHAALRRGALMQLTANKDQYAYVRTTNDEHVLIVLNRGGKAVEIELKDLHAPDGMRLHSWMGGEADVTVAGGKVGIPEGQEIAIYWAKVAK
jgi:glycosidase